MNKNNFNNLVKKIFESIGKFSNFGNNTLYYPDKKAIRGTDIGMTQVDPGKTFPSSDSTLILKFPSSKIKTKIKKKIKQ